MKIETIYYALPDSKSIEPNEVISFYATHSLFLKNITAFNSSEQLQMFIEIIWHYLHALDKKGRMSEITTVSHQHLKVIDAEIDRLNATQLKDDWYYDILFYLGRSHYQLRDFKKATIVFERLSSFDHKNELYDDWLRNSKYRQVVKITNKLLIVLGIPSVFLIVFNNEIENPILKMFLTISLAIFSILCFSDLFLKTYYKIKR